MPTITNDSFDTDSNVFQTVPPLNQGDTFEVDSNVFTSVDPLNQGDTFDNDSYVQPSKSSNELTFDYVLPEIILILPNPAPMMGAVTIEGVLLDKVTAVYFDDFSVPFTVISSTRVTATVPANVNGTSTEVHVEYEL